MMRRERTAEEKWRILEEGRKSGATVAEVCRRNQISETQYYKWAKAAEEAAKERLSGKPRTQNGQDRQVEALRQKIAKQQAIIAEVIQENLEMKKNFSI